MSNTSNGRGIKGSKFWMQEVVNSNLQRELNSFIGEEVEWLSPIKGENSDYLEYELRQDYICNVLGITGEQKKRIFSFWPNRQPQWDGIALSKDKKILYLVEAKAHLAELNSKMSASSKKSKELITASMKEVFEKYYLGRNFDIWIDRYYQLGNRLTFLHKLNEVSEETGFKVKIVLLNFVNDTTYRPTTYDQWQDHYKEVFREMTGDEKVPKDVIVINFPVKK